jgi:hypothetical protein
MRTKTLFLSAALVAAGVASSMAQSNVYSLNIVGYVNVPVVVGQSYLLANPFTDGNGDNIASVFSCLNANSFNWDTSSVFTYSQASGYIEDDYNAGATSTNGSWAPGTTALPPGKGFWFIPQGSGTITFTGSVVLTNSVTLPVGSAIVGSAYPASTNLVALGMNWMANANGFNNDTDAIFRFNSATSSYSEYDFSAGYGWSGPTGGTNGPVLNVAEGFWYVNANSQDTWSQAFTVN